MRFGVLGPLAVWTTDGRPVAVPEVKVRALLADLLVHHGEAVSADRLIDDLWAQGLPANPAGALQTKVWQLRRTLEQAEPGARTLVASRPPGYALEVEADAVDASRFEALTARAQGSDDAWTRAALLTDALALWRGPAFADFADEEFTRAAITRLEEQRLTAQEDLAEARLDLGEHGLLADELADLVSEHPLRERLRAAHMRALYRAGRQSEALASYRELRDLLREELGVDPSPGVVALHRAILEQAPGLAAESAPAASAARPPSNLPAPLTDLIGRDEAVAHLRSLLEGGTPRLVTLTGPGGVGKTRLAIETAAGLAEAFPDGVHLVELTSLDQPGARCESPSSVASVAERVAAVLRIRDDAGAGAGRGRTSGLAPLSARLADALRTKRMLLVVDNCEHVVEPVAELAETLLRAAPRLRILATSREPLGISGEVVQPVPPLELPDPTTEPSPAELARASAVRLFVARAAAAAPGFALDAGNADAVAAICRHLDGIPLALELAATRVRAMSAAELASRLDDRFHVLATGRRGADAKHQTLRATLDWSWNLLTEPERMVLRRLAVHADGCTLEAAEEVCSGAGVQAAEVPALLARLVDRSLVVKVDGADGSRYRLLESVAAYCSERLREAGEVEPVQRRHGRYYTELAERAERQLRGHAQQHWLRVLDAETANLRAALDVAVQQGTADLALRLTGAMAWYWFLRGRLEEGSRSLRSALAVEGQSDVGARAKAMAWWTGMALMAGHDVDPIEGSRTALALYEQVDADADRARAEWFLGAVLFSFGHPTASEQLVTRALTTSRALGDRWGTAAALWSRGAYWLVRSDLPALERDAEHSHALFRELGDRWGQLQAMDSLAELAKITGDYERATRLHRDGLRIAEELGLWTDLPYRLSGLGQIALLTGDHRQAETLYERARQLAAEQSNTFWEAFALSGLGASARKQGKLELAETHVRAALDWYRRIGYEPGIAHASTELGFIAEQRGDADGALALHRDGYTAARLTGDPRATALALEGLAAAQASLGHHVHAAQLLGTAAATRESAGVPLPAAERGDVDRTAAAIRRALGEDAFTTEYERGGALEPDDHLDQATFTGAPTTAVAEAP